MTNQDKHNYKRNIVEVWPKAHFLLFYELLTVPGKTKDELIKFNSPLKRLNRKKLEHHGSLNELFKQDIFSIYANMLINVKKTSSTTNSYLTTKNILKLINAMKKESRLIENEGRLYANENLLPTSQKEYLMKTWRKYMNSDEKELLRQINLFSHTGMKKIRFGLMINLLIRPIIEKERVLLRTIRQKKKIENDEAREKIEEYQKELQIIEEILIDWEYMKNCLKLPQFEAFHKSVKELLEDTPK